MITMEMLSNAYDCGDVQIVDAPYGDGCVCQIGDNWFYFGGLTAADMNAYEYQQRVPKQDILCEIHETLQDLCMELPDEYRYYELHLQTLAHMRQKNVHQDPYEVDRIMMMSTTHISKDSCELLESDDFTAIAFPNPNGYGIIVRCLPGEDHFGDGADDVAACIEYARERGCGYIRFDRDFPAFTDLPVYDW